MTEKKTSLHELKIDGVLCISHEHRADRRERLVREFSDTGLNIEFYIVKAGGNASITDFESHKACAALALKRGYRSVVILEDNVSFEGVTPGQVRRINEFLKSDYPELFYLGATLGKLWLTWQPSIARCVGKSTHAYIINRAGCRKMLKFEYSDQGLHWLFTERFKAYCAFPMISQQQVADFDTRDQYFEGPKNHKHQFSQARRNIFKTLLRRDL